MKNKIIEFGIKSWIIKTVMFVTPVVLWVCGYHNWLVIALFILGLITRIDWKCAIHIGKENNIEK